MQTKERTHRVRRGHHGEEGREGGGGALDGGNSAWGYRSTGIEGTV